jgi:hypothetical protein
MVVATQSWNKKFCSKTIQLSLASKILFGSETLHLAISVRPTMITSPAAKLAMWIKVCFIMLETSTAHWLRS